MNSHELNISRDSSSGDKTSYHWIWALTAAIIVIVTVAFRYMLPLRDGDILYHILYGKYFLEHRTLIADHTLFSWTQTSNDHYYCTWLADIFLYLVHKVSGFSGLIVFRYICVYTLVLSCLVFARHMKLVTNPLTWFICLLSSLMCYTGIIIKPEIFSFLLITLMAWNWFYIRTAQNPSVLYCYLFPIIMLIWINSHGGFIFGVVFITLACTGELLNTKLSPDNALGQHLRKHLLIAYLLTLVSLFITPYGYNYLLQIINYCIPSKENLDMISRVASYNSPFSVNDFFGLLKVMNISILILMILFVRNFRKIEWSTLMLNLVFVFLYTCYYRTTFYWSPVFMFSTLTLLANKPIIPSRYRNRLSASLLLLLLFCVMVWLSLSALHQSKYKPETNAWMGFGIAEIIAEAEVDYIEKNFPDARIGNTYDEGAYLIWRLWPENKVFIDQRHFPYMSWVNDYMNTIHHDNPDEYGEKLEDFVNRYSCDIWLIGHQGLFASQWFYLSPEWQLGFFGKRAAVFVREGIVLPEQDQAFLTEDLSSSRNFANTVLTLQWTMIIQDWKASNVIIKHMEDYFTTPGQQDTTRKFKGFIEKMKARNKSLRVLPANQNGSSYQAN